MITSLRKILVTAAVGGLALGAMAASAGAGEQQDAAPLTILKTVSGPVAEGTTFTATLVCLGPIIVDGGAGTDTATVTFDATGQPTSADTFFFNGPGECTVTETADGGATTTTYSCDGVLPPAAGTGFRGAAVPEEQVCTAAGPQADPIPVNIISPGQSATVTIANTFTPPPPPPPPPVVTQPAFTG